MPEEWKSPRKVEEEETLYFRERFEHYMSKADRGEITRVMAIKAIQDEMNFVELDGTEELF